MNQELQTLLTSFPVPTATVNAWVQDPPIWYAVPTPNTGAWSRRDIEATIENALLMLSQPGVPLVDIMKDTLRCIWLYREMRFPRKTCQYRKLNDGMVAVLFQLINNIIDTGSHVGMAHFGSDLSTARHEPGITIEHYPAP